MYHPLDISNFFIQEYGQTNDITPMKLVKLVYISHGWYLGITGNVLIDENPEAWQYGPVIPTVYHHFKSHGRNPIRNNEFLVDPCSVIDSDTQSFLRKIWESYGRFSALDLSAMTHQVGTPWYVTYHNIVDNTRRGSFGIYSKQIHETLIRDHYKAKLASSHEEVTS